MILDDWGWCTGTTQRDGTGREEGSGWGTRVYLWRIHVDIWQNQYNIVKFKNKKRNWHGLHSDLKVWWGWRIHFQVHCHGYWQEDSILYLPLAWGLSSLLFVPLRVLTMWWLASHKESGPRRRQQGGNCTAIGPDVTHLHVRCSIH